MRRVVPVPFLAAFGVALAVAQTPEPPRPLPASIAGPPRPAAPPVAPAGGVAAPAAPVKQAPIARFNPLLSFPPETVQAVYGMRTGAEWLARRQLPHGRFLFGVNPALKTPLDGDTDYRQAVAAWGVCMAARFTGDDKLAATGGQAILTLLTLCKDDPADPACKTPALPPAGGNPVGFAAALVLAAYELPTADVKLHAEVEKLVGFLRKQVRSDGAVACGEPADPECETVYPGLVLQALAASHTMRPDAGKAEAVTKGLAFYREAFRKTPHPSLAGTVIPAAVEWVLRTRSPDAAACALEMADWLCAAQYGKAGAQPVPWSGGFRTSLAEAAGPGFESAHAARGLAAACHLLHTAVPDLARYAKYRPAAVEALDFVRSLQYTADNTAHFEGTFRSQFLLGGVRAGIADGNIRADATALAVAAFQRFLESGAADKK